MVALGVPVEAGGRRAVERFATAPGRRAGAELGEVLVAAGSGVEPGIVSIGGAFSDEPPPREDGTEREGGASRVGG